MKETIKEYWEDRAKEKAATAQATTNDVYLRELEIATFIQTLKEIELPDGASILDVGCGDGYTTVSVAEALPQFSFDGLDYSENMISLARDRVAEKGSPLRVKFSVGDATNLTTVCGNRKYDAVMTDRCLINLESIENQQRAIAEIAAVTRPGGYYLGIENFREGQDEMNRLRASVGLPEIPIRWHNLFFTEAEFSKLTDPFFEELSWRNFSSSYYFATRVIYSAMCQMRGETPDYRHEIHELSIKLPWFGNFSPIRMAVTRRRAAEQ